MNTQPTNEYLNRERLTDLAQFAVPGGHDLWPRIEKAARASASGMTTPRQGILSLGLSRAWTAVGIVLIAATFAALGFGLAVLVLSNDSDQVPAAQPEATVTPTPATATSTPIPATSQADANTPPLFEPDYPRDLDHIRETLGSVFVPTYVPDGYQLTEAEVNINELRRLVMWVEHEAALTYGNGFPGIESTAIGEFSILQFPEGWDPTKLNPDFGEVSAFNPEFEESTVNGLTIWQDPELESPGFHFQVDSRWLWISVFEAPDDTVDLDELVKVAKSVKRFGGGDSVDWLTVSGITRHGFENTALDDLNDFIEGRNDTLQLYAYLPGGLALKSVWVTESTGDLTLEFVLPSYLKDGKRLERVTLRTRSYAIRFRDQVDVGGSPGYVSWDTSSSEVTLIFQQDGRWLELKGFPATVQSALDELIKMAVSLELYGVPQQPSSAQTNTITPSTIPSREAAHAKMLTILTGETLDRYRALPPAYQEALGLYTWHSLSPDIVRSAVKDKLDQWGDAVIPLPELLGEDRAGRFERLEGEIYNHAYLLVSYYVLVLNTESSDKSRAEAMQQYVDYIARVRLTHQLPNRKRPAFLAR